MTRAGRLLASSLLATVIVSGCDPSVHLSAINLSAGEVLVRLEYDVEEGPTFRVLSVGPGQETWLIAPMIGTGPNRVVVMDEHCAALKVFHRPDNVGRVRVEPDKSVSLERDAPQRALAGPHDDSRCAAGDPSLRS